MRPANCLRNDDCVRACVASILELETEDLPNWFDDVDGDHAEQQRNMQEWLASRGYIAAIIGLPGSWHYDEMFNYMRHRYSDKYYMLWCNSNGDHAVVCQNDAVVHNPAWYKSPIDGPHSSGHWIIWIIAHI